MKNSSSFKVIPLIIIFLFFIFHFSFAQIITTSAGIGAGAYDGDGGQATDAEIQNPSGVCVDAAGNLFFADQSNNRIREVNTSGIITTVAGNGVGAFTGDGGPATDAEISSPQGIFADNSGNIFFTDFFNNRIREVNTSGVINTLAGLSSNSYSGDGGPATAAELNAPSGVVTDTLGNVYIADEANNRIRIISTSGIINTFAGNGVGSYNGDGGPATAAEINNVTGVGIDAAQNIYIADLNNRRVRKVNTSGIITTVAGNGVTGLSGDGGQASAAELAFPAGVCFDGMGNMYIGDNYRVRMVNTSGIITTVAGTGTSGYSGDGGPATAAAFNYAFGVAADANGDFWLGDVFNNRVRKITGPNITGITKESYINQGISLYPNPNNGVFSLALSHAELISASQTIIEIYNVLGEKVYNATLLPLTPEGALNSINLTGQPNGVYFYWVITENGTQLESGKVIIDK